jgi:hypothetical protein
MPRDALSLAVIALGWPAVLASVTLVLVGVVQLRWRVALIGALAGCPFLLYLFGTPRFGWAALAAGALYLGSAWAVARSRRVLALVLAAPFIVEVGLVAWLVISQPVPPFGQSRPFTSRIR